MKSIRIFVVVLTGFFLYGCSDPTMHSYQGRTYWVGDGDCKSFIGISEATIQCYDSDGMPTHQRRALTDQEVYAELQRQEREAAYNRQMAAQRRQAMINQTNQYIQNVQPSLPNSNTTPSYNSYASPTSTSQNKGTPIYTAGECRGTVANNRCIGVIIPNPGYQKRCYGPIINGECRGPYY